MIADAPDLVTRDPRHLLVRVNGEPEAGIDPAWFGFVRPRSALNHVVTIQPREGLGGSTIGNAQSGLRIGSGFAALFGGPVGAIFGPIAEIIGGTILEGLRRSKRTGRQGAIVEGGEKFNTAGISINPIKLGEPLPGVMGTMKVSPPPVAPSWTEQRNNDVFANFHGGLEGEGEWSDIRVNGSPIGDIEGAVVSSTEGADGDTNIQFEGADLPTVIEERINIELPSWDAVTDGANPFVALVDQSDPTTSRPKKPTAKAKSGANQIWLTFIAPNGASPRPGSTSVGQGLRISMRKRGDTTWRFLPYLKLLSSIGNPNPFRFHVRLIFAADPGGLTLTNAEPFDKVLQEWDVLALLLTHDAGNEIHVADPYFTTSDVAPRQKVVNNAVGQEVDHLKIYLDPADLDDPWDVGEWEVRVDPGGPRSIALGATSVRHYHIMDNAVPKTVPGGGQGKQNEVGFGLFWESITSYFDEYPVQAPNVAQLFVRVPNIQVNEVTAIFKRKLKVWNGSQWTGSVITSNPAAAIRAIWTDPRSAEPFPEGYLNNQELGDFYDHCAANGLEFNALLEDGTQHDWPVRIAKLAKAKVKLGAKRGVWWDKDRSLEAPVAHLSGHNGQGIKLLSQRDPAPHGYKCVNFFDRDEDYRETPRTVYRSGFSALNATDVRHFDAEGLVTTAQIDDVVGYLLNEFAARNVFISATLSIEGRLIDRGDLIAVSSDALDSQRGSARIKSIQTSGDNVIGLTLSNKLPLTAIADDFFGPADHFDPADFFTPLNKAGVTLVLDAPNPQVVTHAINETSDKKVITFVTPFATPANLSVGSIVMAGPVGREVERMYVLEKSGGPDETVNVLCMPEANSLVI